MGGGGASFGGGAIVAVGANVTVFFCFVDFLRKIRLRKDCVCDFVVITSMFGTKKVGSSQRYHDALEGSPCFVCKIYGIGYTFNSHIPNHVFFRHSICCHVIFYFTAQSERQVVFDHLYNMLSTKVWLLFLLGKQSMLPFSHAVRLATVACITRKSLKQYPILNIMSSRTVS